MVDRTRIRPMHNDPMSNSLMDEHYPKKKSRDSSHSGHQWFDSTSSSGIMSLMDIDVMQDPYNTFYRRQMEYHGGNNNPEHQGLKTITPLLDVDVTGAPPSGGGVMPFATNVPSSPVYPSFPVALRPALRLSTQPVPLINPQPRTKAPGLPEGTIPSLLDLPLGAGSLMTGIQPEAAREAEFESLVEKLVISVKNKLPLYSVTPVKALESVLQRCKLPRGVRKYKQLDKASPMMCKVYVNELLLGVGVGATPRDADVAAYTRALKLLRETAFEDIVFGRPLREEITEMMANLSQPSAPSPSSHRQFVVLEDRKAGEGSNSYFILALSAEFSGRKISVTSTEENGQWISKVLLDEEEIAKSVGEDEVSVRRTASNEALISLKGTCPVIEVISNVESWRYEIRKNLKSKMSEKTENLDNYISKQRKFDEAIVVCTSELGLKSPIGMTAAKDLNDVFTHILEVYTRSGSASPLIIAPLPARSQRLLLFRLARQRGLCTESIRMSANFNYDLALVPVIRRCLRASVLLPFVKKADGNCTERFRLVTMADVSAS